MEPPGQICWERPATAATPIPVVTAVPSVPEEASGGEAASSPPPPPPPPQVAQVEEAVTQTEAASMLLGAIAGFDKERRLKKVKRQSRIFAAKRMSASRNSLGGKPPMPPPAGADSDIASVLARAILRRRNEMHYDEEE